MALQTQQIDVVLGRGVDGDVDPKRQVPGSLEILENGLFDKRGRINKRKGFERLGVTGLPASSITQLFTQGDRLLAWGSEGVYEYSEERDDWAPAKTLDDYNADVYNGPIPTKVRTIDAIGQLSGDGAGTDVAPDVDLAVSGDGAFIALVAAEDPGSPTSNPARHYWIYEVSTGRVIHHSDVGPFLSSSIRQCVAYDGTSAFVFLEDVNGSGNVVLRVFEPGVDPSATTFELPAAQTLTPSATIDTAKPVRLISGIGGVVWLVYAESATGRLVVDQIINGGATLGPWFNLAGFVVSTTFAVEGLEVAAGLLLVYQGNSTSPAATNRHVVLLVDTTITNTTVAAIVLDTAVGGSDEKLEHAGFVALDSNTFVITRTIVDDDGTTSGQNRFVEVDQLDLSVGSFTRTKLSSDTVGEIRTPQGDASSRALARYPQQHAGIPLGVLTFDSVEDSHIDAWTVLSEGAIDAVDIGGGTLLSVRRRNEPVAVLSADDSAGAPEPYYTSRTAKIGDEIVAAQPFVTEIYTTNAVRVRNFGVRLVFTDCAPADSLPRAEAQGLLYVGGGCPRIVDTSLCLATPLQPVEVFEIGSGAGSIYQMRVTPEILDSVGLVHRGPTSGPATGQNADDEASYSALVSRWPQFGREGAGRHLVHRTIADGTVFYLDRVRGYNTAGAAFASEDTEIDENPLLIAQRPGLEPVALPAVRAMAVWNGRLWVAPSARRGALWPSKLFAPGRGAEFAGELELRVDEGGEITGLAALPGALAVFQANQVLAVAGDGPDDNGRGGSFSRPTPVLETVGCTETASILETPVGVFFRSEHGLRLLAPGFALAKSESGEVGREVDDELEGATVLSAVALRSRELAVWSLSSGRLLVYDWSRGQWSVFDLSFVPLEPTALAEWQGRIVFVEPGQGAIFVESAASYTDDGEYVPLKIRTGWISLAGIAGYQRVRRASVAVERISSVPMQVTVETDRSASPQARTWTASEADDADDVLQVHVRDQLGSRVRVTVEDTQPGGAPTEGYAVLGIQLEVGVKRGQSKRTSGTTR